MKMKPYVICAKPRVVLFGYCSDEEVKKDHPTLTNARMAVYWSSEVRGVLGLASGGPTENCRITPAVPELTIREDVEGVMLCSVAAAQAWEKEPWGE